MSLKTNVFWSLYQELVFHLDEATFITVTYAHMQLQQ